MKIQLISVNRPFFYFHIVLSFSRKSLSVLSLLLVWFLWNICPPFFFLKFLFLYASAGCKASGTVDFVKVLRFSLAFGAENTGKKNLPLSLWPRLVSKRKPTGTVKLLTYILIPKKFTREACVTSWFTYSLLVKRHEHLWLFAKISSFASKVLTREMPVIQ